jgi:hypothetical protein
MIRHSVEIHCNDRSGLDGGTGEEGGMRSHTSECTQKLVGVMQCEWDNRMGNEQ